MPTYEIQTPDGRVFEIDGPRMPSRGELQSMQTRGVFGASGRPGYEPAPPPTARQQSSERPGRYVHDMLANVPRDAWEQGKGIVTGTGQLLGTAARATSEVGLGLGNFVRDVVGLEPHGGGSENLQALAGVPRAVVSHYGQYLDPNARAERVREHPVGTVLDLLPVGAGLKAGARGAAMATRASAQAVRHAPARAIDAAIGIVTGRPVAAVKGAAGYGPVQTAKDAYTAVRSATATPEPAAPVVATPRPKPIAPPPAPVVEPVAPSPAPAAPMPRQLAAQQFRPKTLTNEEVTEILRLKEQGYSHDVAIDTVVGRRGATPAAPASPAALDAPAASSPAVSASSVPSASPVSAPVHPVPRGLSPQRIQNDLGIQARRQGVMLTEPQYKAATELVAQGQTPAEAVTEVARRTAPAQTAPTQAPNAPSPAETAPAPTKAKGAPRAKLTADEADEYLRLLEKGLPHEEAVVALMQQRQLVSKMGTMAPGAMRERVARRLSRDNRTASEGPQEATTSAQNTPVQAAVPVEPVAPPVEPTPPVPAAVAPVAPQASPEVAAVERARATPPKARDIVIGGTYRNTAGEIVSPVEMSPTSVRVSTTTRDGRKTSSVYIAKSVFDKEYKRVAGPRTPKPAAPTPPAPEPTPAPAAASEDTFIVVRYPTGNSRADIVYAVPGSGDKFGMNWTTAKEQTPRGISRAEVAHIAETSDVTGSDIRVFRNGDYQKPVTWEEVQGKSGYDPVADESIYDPSKAWKTAAAPVKPAYQYTAEDKAIVDRVNPPAKAPTPKAADPLAMPDSSPEYLAALEKSREASRRFTDVQKKYRAGEINDAGFRAERKTYDQSISEFDRAYVAEEGRRPTPKNPPQVAVKPAPTTVTKTAKKATTPAVAAEKVRSQVEKVIDLQGAKSAGDVQRRVIAALEAEVAGATQANAKYGAVEVHPHRAYGGREFHVTANGEVIADVDRYGKIQASYGVSDELIEALGGKPVELGKTGNKSTLGQIDRASDMTPTELHRLAKARVSQQLSRASGAGTITVQIPGDGTFTIERNPHAIQEVIDRMKTGGSRPWRGLIADEKPLPVRKNDLPDAAFADRPWTKWEP